MAPSRLSPRESAEPIVSEHTTRRPLPTSPQRTPTTLSPANTPHNRPKANQQRLNITRTQKQALMENLQLEITERARKLRAQYMLQAQGLRTRIEIRVNRIPTALRQAKMGDLLRKYGDVSAPNIYEPNNLRNRLPHINVLAAPKSMKAGPSPQRGMKRTRSAILQTHSYLLTGTVTSSALIKKTKTSIIPRSVTVHLHFLLHGSYQTSRLPRYSRLDLPILKHCHTRPCVLICGKFQLPRSLPHLSN
ncbi:contains a borealin domain/predicted protein/conserved in related fungi [Blumeria hordei DH14]|uniref:Borealin N-terminal domain-containing protein n=1 Tax=Blumeria graminis f. sp. hordei (strain DH14) TaxID=546991 RepID=N1JDK3_BLUG1|nr:contains a borealin domain/predicted protein/conserved in related fungi [Blumeria hordei DH14]